MSTNAGSLGQDHHADHVTSPSPHSSEATAELKAALRELLATVLERAFGVVLEKVEHLAKAFDDIAARGGLGLNALVGGVRARMSGRNAVWGAIKGAVASLSPGAKAALVIGLVLALLLLPLTVVLLLLVLIAVAVAAVVSARSTS